MNLNLRKMVIGSHLLFAREGTLINASPVSQIFKPEVEAQPPYANWTDLGEVYDFMPDHKETEEDIMAPSPGAYRRTDNVVTSTTLDLTFTLANMSELVFESIMQAAAAITANAYQPGMGTGKLRGWVKCQQYGQDNALRNVFDVYVSGTFKGQKLDSKLIKPELTCKVLYSALASGNLTLGN